MLQILFAATSYVFQESLCSKREWGKWLSTRHVAPELPLEPRKNGKREKEESWRDGGSRAECKDNGEVVSLATTALWMVSDKSTTGYKVSD